MLKIKINEKEYNYPESFDEITMKQYCDIFYNLEDTNGMSDEDRLITTVKNESKIMSRLLGEKDDFLLNLPSDIYKLLADRSKFIYDVVGYLDSKQFYINIDGKKYFMPEPKDMSLRQFIDADVTMKEKDSKNQFIELLSILLLPLGKDGKYYYDGNYQDLIPKIEKMKASECLPFIYTFFKKKVISKRIMNQFSEVAEEGQRLLNIQNS